MLMGHVTFQCYIHAYNVTLQARCNDTNVKFNRLIDVPWYNLRVKLSQDS